MSAPGYARVFASLSTLKIKCYGEDVTVPPGLTGDVVCPSTPAPAPGFGFTP